MDYVVGDLQGCCDAFDRLLAEVGFSPSRDRLAVVGDLVNRGPDSLGTLKRLRGLGDAATCLLGNHDLHLLAVAHGVRKPRKDDTLHDILDSTKRDEWLDWLRQRRMAYQFDGWLLVHAGVLPQWDVEKTLALAGEVEDVLRGPELPDMLQLMYGNEPAQWSESLHGAERWRFVVNVLTRIRFCTPNGKLDLKIKEGANAAPPGFRPWFDIAGRRSEGMPIAFGHWSTLGRIDRPDLLALDTGCVWGGQLSAVRIDGGRREWVQVKCKQALAPG
jgi:bis(5'-nucleosyl)-tetraphosphatase (symmetrical)